MFWPRGSGSLLACCLLFGAVGHAQAAEFYAIIANLNNARAPQAQIDVAVDTRAAPGPTSVLFNVFGPEGIQLAVFEVRRRALFYASRSGEWRE